MISLSVITWRLGDLDVEDFEYLIEALDEKDQYQLELEDQYNDIFYLKTCQRVIVVTALSKAKMRQFYLKWSESNELDPVRIVEPLWYHGMDALYHLGEVVSALDSAVIGEEQIQGQFKQEYTRVKGRLSPLLQTVIQQVLRTGKRVRKRSLLQPGQISTISVISQFIHEELQEAGSIGIIGTGKMARGIIKYLRQTYSDTKLHLYTTTESRVGEYLDHIAIENFDTIRDHQVIFTATARNAIITDSYVDEHDLHDTVFVDLGMPRNCSFNNQNLVIYTMEQVVKQSIDSNRSEIVSSAYYVLEDELKQIKLDLIKQQNSEKIKKLRMEMLNAAISEKTNLVDEDTNKSKQFDQLVNRLIHISQQHLEDHILTEHHA